MLLGLGLSLLRGTNGAEFSFKYYWEYLGTCPWENYTSLNWEHWGVTGDACSAITWEKTSDDDWEGTTTNWELMQ